MKAKHYVLGLFILSSILLLIGNLGDNFSAAQENRSLHFLRSLSQITFVISGYLSLVVYDLDAGNLKRLKVFYYLLLLGSTAILGYTILIDFWISIIVLYLFFITLVHMLIITWLRYTMLKEHTISIRKEWLSLLLWTVLAGVIIFIMVIRS